MIFQKKECKRLTFADHVHRVSYAVPLEIIYLTPLLKWNPYNIPFVKGKIRSSCYA